MLFFFFKRVSRKHRPADLENADLKNTDLENVDLENADRENADLENNDLVLAGQRSQAGF